MNRIKRLILAGIGLLLVISVAAKDDPATVIVLRGDKGAIKKDTSITNADTKYYADPTNLSYDPATCRYLNIVTLKINEESVTYIPVNFQVSVLVTITCTDAAEKTISFDTTLTVTYRKDTSCITRSFWVGKGYRKVVVKIKDNPTKDVTWDVSKILVVENEMRVSRDYIFNSDKIIENLSAGFPKLRGIEQSDELLVSWNDPNCGQTEYDLEWAWIDSSALNEYKGGTGNFIDRIVFDHNASRVTISANRPSYRLPLIYDGGGGLFYRVRPVQIRQNGTRTEGRWTSVVDGATLHAFAFTGHQNNLNWQVNTTYAEEGKRKTVVQYFDGSLRNRQTVTKDNSLDTATTVVAETFYDYQGRASIQVLPAPTLNTMIAYTKKLNQGINGSGMPVEYTKDLYDRLTGSDTLCKKPAAAMSTASGASQYYSADNPVRLEGINKYIPDARKYPFTETRYTPDGTGRIAAQSGVGPDHTLGSGHETKYYYGQADQEDLDLLFGTDVGYASHYFKNMVRDANGQYSVSYVDMHGRTIATALTGKSPANLDTLPSQTARANITKNLLDAATNIVKGRSIEATKELLVPVDGAYRFAYKLNPKSLQLADKNKQDICYSCMYDLSIYISNDCNNCGLPGNQPIVISRSNFNINKLDSICANAPDFLIVDTTIHLQEGSYTIRKTLTLSSDAQDHYRNGLYTRRNTIKTFEDVKKEMLSFMQSTQGSCVLSCDACRAKLGDYTTYRKNLITQSGLSAADAALQEPAIQAAYNQAKTGCDAICTNGSNRITDLRKAMLLDMTPGYGQYAVPENSDQVYNIFRRVGFIIKREAFRKPVNETTGAPDCYINDNVNPSDLCSIDLGGTTPLSTMTKDAFTTAFQRNWATSLLYYHPEYPRLQLAETTLKPSYDWDHKIQQMTSWNEAAAFINNIMDADPFLNLPGNLLYKLQMATKVNSNFYRDSATKKQVSMWQVAWASVFCTDTAGAMACITNDKNKTPAGFVINAACAKDWDNVWGTFRQLYLFEKEKMVYAWSTQHIASPVSVATLVGYGYKPRFIDPSNLSTYPGGLIGNVPTDTNKGKRAASDSANQFYKDNCSANAVWWQEQLLSAFHQCNPAIDSTALAPLVAQLVIICVKGSDSSHPFGSASISPDSTAAAGSYKNFVDAIAGFMKAKGMSYTATCNPYILDNPKPYEVNPTYYDQEVWTKPDSCTCSRIADLKSTAIKSGYITGGSGTFSDYLLKYYSTSISQGTLDSLEARCKGKSKSTLTLATDCKFLEKPLILPPVLQCAATPVAQACLSCDTMRARKKDFSLMMGGAAPTIIPKMAADSATNTAFEKFMNYKTGFSYSWLDYLQFSDSCSSYGIPQGDIIDCAALQKLINDYKAQQSDLYDSCKTVKWKINNAFSFVDYLPVCAAIDSGRLHLPPAYQKDGAKTFDFSDPSICMPDQFSITFRLKVSKEIGRGANLDFGLIFREPNTTPGDKGKFISIGLTPTANTASRSNINIDNAGSAYPSPLVDLAGGEREIKIEKLASEYCLYIDGAYTASYAHNHHISDYLRFSLLNYNPGVELDWVKFYDERGKLIYDEEFNSNTAFAKVDNSYRCAVNCPKAFGQYFNEQRKTNYTLEQIDSVYLATCGHLPMACSADTAINCARLQYALDSYLKIYTRVDTIYETQMVTFGGNPTPAEGPKGVFDVNSRLIENTIDSPDTNAIKTSFVQIWNRSTDNRKVGTLSLLANGKLGLQLNAGQIFPCKGIVGMRYYQFDTDTSLVDGLQTTVGSFLNFGDGSWGAFDNRVPVPPGNHWVVYPPATKRDLANHGLLQTYSGYAVHDYATRGLHTITVYHSDTLGFVGFDNLDSATHSLTHFKNLRGYFPQQTLSINFHSTQDSTFNTFANIRNFATISGLQFFGYANGDYGLKVSENKHRIENNRLCLNRLHRGLRVIDMYYDYHPYSRPFIGIQPILATMPGWDTLYQQLEVINLANFTHHITPDTHFKFPKLKIFSILVAEGGVSASEIDRIVNEIAASTTLDSGYLRIDYTAVTHTAASAAAIKKLKDRGWTFCGNAVNDGNPDDFRYLEGVYPTTWRVRDSIPYIHLFTRYYNKLMGTSYSHAQLQRASLERCGKVLSICEPPDKVRTVAPTLCGNAQPVYPRVRVLQDTVCNDVLNLSVNKATEYYTYYKDSLANVFDTAYYNKCMSAKDIESFTVTHSVYEHHYTLYYYDQAGNLVKTVPPAGVKANYNATWLQSVQTARSNNTTVVPTHTLTTQYRYNTLNEVVEQQTPDAGKSNFWYDRLGRLAVSQNAKQTTANLYSYTFYDPLGRITEVGQQPQTTVMTQAISQDTGALTNWFKSGSTREQITRTVYDVAYQPFTTSPSPLWQRNLRGRVSYVQLWDKASDGEHKAATYYTYDTHGSVDTLLQDINQGSMKTTGNRFKKIIYDYDLISGKVNSVAYQKGSKDQFFHRYQYDAENRLTVAYTSPDGIYYERDAQYQYYKHGPLARTVLGQLQVQGTDYAYTLQGWLKGVNSTSLQTADDMGRDGITANTAAKDIFGFSLNYYGNEYKPIGSSNPFSSVTTLGSAYKPLYNGNISAMVVNLPKAGEPILYNYKYDQLNRLTAMDAYTGLNTATNTWTPIATDDYKESISYDANGNIQKYYRNGAAKSGKPLSMDALSYHYYTNTNRLQYVKDTVTATNYTEDIDNQSDTLNYAYDDIGNLITDKAAGLNKIDWTVYGKIGKITKADGTVITYYYDAGGNRTGKDVNGKQSWYVRDAQGNVMSVYTKENAAAPVIQSEVHLYGSSRLGIWNGNRNTTSLLLNTGNGILVRGEKNYELSNHLGNVLATLSDKKIGIDNNKDSIVDVYEPHVTSAQDYYPGGMMMPGRKYNGDKVVYGFNGKRKDNEMYGDGNAYNFENRIYDPRLDRWLSVDALQSKTPHESPYIYCGNNPLIYIDPDGKKKILTTITIYQKSDGVIKVVDSKVISNELKMKTRMVSDAVFTEDKNAFKGQVAGYDWYDINEIHTIIIKDGKKISNTTTSNPGAYRTSTDLSWQWIANLKLGDGIGEGGIAFYSSNGQGQETRKAQFPDGKMEDAGILIDAINASKSAAEATSLLNEFVELLGTTKNIDKITKGLEFYKHLNDVVGATKIELNYQDLEKESQQNQNHESIDKPKPYRKVTINRTNHGGSYLSLRTVFDPKKSDTEFVTKYIDTTKKK